MLRPHFRYNRTLLKDLCRIARDCLVDYPSKTCFLIRCLLQSFAFRKFNWRDFCHPLTGSLERTAEFMDELSIKNISRLFSWLLSPVSEANGWKKTF